MIAYPKHILCTSYAVWNEIEKCTIVKILHIHSTKTGTLIIV